MMVIMQEERLLKKYPNRRLYDTTESRYVTLKEVKELIFSNVKIKVLDRQSNEDITRHILLQIIMEQETLDGGEPLFNADVLYHFIRNYSDTYRDSFTEHLEQSLDFFNTQQRALEQQLDSTFSNTPMEFWLKMGEQNLKTVQQMQQSMLDSVIQSRQQPVDDENEKNK